MTLGGMTLRAWTGVAVAAVVAGLALLLADVAPPRRATTRPAPPAGGREARSDARRDAPASRPAGTRPTPAAVPAVVSPPADVLALLRLDDPQYPTTRPLDVPADLTDAAKIVLTHPAYVDPAGDLWLTHPAGKTVAGALAGPVVDHTVVVRDPVDYVSRPADGDAATGGVAVLKGHFPDADFTRAQAIEGGVVVPTPGAVLLLKPDLTLKERVGLTTTNGHPARGGRVVLASAGRGVWAWSPCEEGAEGGRAVFVDAGGGHVPDASAGWPDRPVQLIPLADGSVLTVAVGDDGFDRTDTRRVFLKSIRPAAGPPAADLLKTVEPLARQLADPEPAAREAAQRALEAQGPAALPVLESLRESLPPEAQLRIEALLGQRFAPTLGGLRPLEGGVETIARFPGGGCVLRLTGGGTVTGDDGQENTVIPATVLIRPGHFVERIDPAAVCDFVPGRQSIQCVNDELVIADPVAGPRRWIGTNLFPLLPPAYADFDTVMAVDARRRWLFSSKKRPGRTLLLDPSLPDTTPKLPVWTIDAPGEGKNEGGGWTDDGWPAVVRGGRLFVLGARGWTTAGVDRLRQRPATRPAGGPAEAGPAAPPKDVPADARVVRVGEHVFAYTPDGRVRRYRAAGPKATDLAFEVEFTQDVPTRATRVWADPAGRLVFLAPGRVAVAFPDGRVPAEIADLMLRVPR